MTNKRHEGRRFVRGTVQYDLLVKDGIDGCNCTLLRLEVDNRLEFERHCHNGREGD